MSWLIGRGAFEENQAAGQSSLRVERGGCAEPAPERIAVPRAVRTIPVYTLLFSGSALTAEGGR